MRYVKAVIVWMGLCLVLAVGLWGSEKAIDAVNCAAGNCVTGTPWETWSHRTSRDEGCRDALEDAIRKAKWNIAFAMDISRVYGNTCHDKEQHYKHVGVEVPLTRAIQVLDEVSKRCVHPD